MGDQELLEEFKAELPKTLVEVIKSEDVIDIISIDNQNLSALPSSIGRFANLRILYLNNNRLRDLPSSIRHLHHLERIELSNNTFSQFPSNLTKVTSLRDLNLSHNSIREIPAEMNKLVNLESIDISQNEIQTVASLEDLHKLEEINLSNNNIKIFPKLPSDSLRRVFLNSNTLENLSGIDKLTTLETFEASNNPLTQEPLGLSDHEYLINVDLSSTTLKKINQYYAGRFKVRELQIYLTKMKESNDTHTCNKCGHTQAIGLIECVECDSIFEHCYVCKKGFVENIRARCRECNTQFHDEHIRRMLKLTSKCPNCKALNTILL